MQVVVLAGGLATRMKPATETVPKYLLQVAGQPFADHQLTWLAAGGVTDVVLCVGHLGDAIRDHVGDGARFGLRVTYTDERDGLRGTAGALRLAFDDGLLEAEPAVLYGDSYLDVDLRAVFADFTARRPDALMCTLRNLNRWDASNVSVADGWVTRYEKGVPDPVAAGMDRIDYGLSILDRDRVVATIPSGLAIDLADIYGALAAAGRLAAHEVSERFYEIGSPEGLAELESLLRSRSAPEARA